MVTKKIVILVYLVLLGPPLLSQDFIEPLELVRKVFSKNPGIDIKSYSCGKYSENGCRPNGFSIKERINLELTIQNDTNAIVTLTLLDSLNQEFLNGYVYLTKKGIWKIYDVEESPTFQLGLDKKLEVFYRYSDNQIDSICVTANSTRTKFKAKLMFASMNNATDNYLISYFKDRQENFNQLITLDFSHVNSDSIVNLGLYISDIIDDKYTGCILFKMNESAYGHGDVGYLYAKSEANLPAIAPRTFVIIRKIIDNFYLYRHY